VSSGGHPKPPALRFLKPLSLRVSCALFLASLYVTVRICREGGEGGGEGGTSVGRVDAPPRPRPRPRVASRTTPDTPVSLTSMAVPARATRVLARSLNKGSAILPGSSASATFFQGTIRFMRRRKWIRSTTRNTYTPRERTRVAAASTMIPAPTWGFGFE
jgi:hypothetical protein